MIHLRHQSVASGILFLVVVIAVISQSGRITPVARRGSHEDAVDVRISEVSRAVIRGSGGQSAHDANRPGLGKAEALHSVDSFLNAYKRLVDEGLVQSEGTEAVFKTPVAYNEKASEWLSVQSDASGSLLSVDGRTAQVVGFQQVSGSGGVALSLMVDPIGKLDASGEDTEKSAVSMAESPVFVGERDSEASVSVGLTYEQQLFRTKWGWHAFDQVQKVLREKTSD